MPYDQKDLRQWVKNGTAKIPNIKWKDINRFFCSGDSGEEISKGTFILKRNDYRSLVGRNYVNDLVIEEYFDIIKERNFIAGLPVIGTTLVFLYKQFDNKSFDEAWKDTKRWNKNDLRQYDIILCPIHKSDHWSLISIDTNQKTIEYYDSIIGSRKTSNAPRIMKKSIEEYYNSRGEKQTFKVKICEDAPIQENGVDCGIFVCQNAEN